MVAFTILSLSKLQFMKNIYSVYLSPFPAYKIDTKVLYLDTDGACFFHQLDKSETSLDTFWKALRKISSQMDYSDFDLSSPLYADSTLSAEERNKLLEDREKNKKKIGLFASEIGSRVVSKAAFMQSKSYCLSFEDNKAYKLAMKGARHRKLDLKIEELEKFILGHSGKRMSYDHVYITSMRQELYIRKTKKNIMNRLYTKRYMIDANRTLSYGHPLIIIHQLLMSIVDQVSLEIDGE